MSINSRVCNICDRTFNPSSGHPTCPACRGMAAKHKCLSCDTMIRKNSTRCVHCNGKNASRENSPTWKGGRVRDSKGYIMCMDADHPRASSNHGYVFEHILVMEEQLGRYLETGENVHHINGIKDDNRPENLELWIRPQPSGIRVRDAVTWAREIIEKYGHLP